MTLLVVTGRGGKAASETANRNVARARALARHVDDLVVLEADESWSTPVGTGKAETSWRTEPVELHLDVRQPGTVVLLLDADLDQVKRIHPLARKVDLPVLWWHEEPPSEAVVAEVSHSIAGLLTTWTDHPAVPGWLWSVGAGIDLDAVPLIETFPARPPLRLLAWAPTGQPDMSGVLQALAFARGLTADVHLTIALTDSGPANGPRHQIEAQIRNLALTRSAHIALIGGPGSFPRMLAQAHALVDVEGADDAPNQALLAMAHGRPVLSWRKQFAELLDTAPLPLWSAPGDERQLGGTMKSLATAWSEELDAAGQALRSAVRQEHSVGHWAEAVGSIVELVRARRQRGTDEPVAPESGAAAVALGGNRPSAPSPSSEPSGADAPDDAANRGSGVQRSGNQ
jgi:hypothetical protein